MSWQANVRWLMEFCNIPRTVAQTMMMCMYSRFVLCLEVTTFRCVYFHSCLLVLDEMKYDWTSWGNPRGGSKTFELKRSVEFFLVESLIECFLYPSAKLKLGLDGVHISLYTKKLKAKLGSINSCMY